MHEACFRNKYLYTIYMCVWMSKTKLLSNNGGLRTKGGSNCFKVERWSKYFLSAFFPWPEGHSHHATVRNINYARSSRDGVCQEYKGIHIKKWSGIIDISIITNSHINIIRENLRNTSMKVPISSRLMDDGLLNISGCQISSLRPPYGNCGEKSMHLYTEGTPYTRSRCAMQCISDYTINRCGCADLHMPGDYI